MSIEFLLSLDCLAPLAVISFLMACIGFALGSCRPWQRMGMDRPAFAFFLIVPLLSAVVFGYIFRGMIMDADPRISAMHLNLAYAGVFIGFLGLTTFPLVVGAVSGSMCARRFSSPPEGGSHLRLSIQSTDLTGA